MCFLLPPQGPRIISTACDQGFDSVAIWEAYLPLDQITLAVEDEVGGSIAKQQKEREDASQYGQVPPICLQELHHSKASIF